MISCMLIICTQDNLIYIIIYFHERVALRLVFIGCNICLGSRRACWQPCMMLTKHKIMLHDSMRNNQATVMILFRHINPKPLNHENHEKFLSDKDTECPCIYGNSLSHPSYNHSDSLLPACSRCHGRERERRCHCQKGCWRTPTTKLTKRENQGVDFRLLNSMYGHKLAYNSCLWRS